MKHLGITAIVAAVVFGMPLLPALAQDHQMQKQGDQPMAMGGMMEECRKHCDAVSATMAVMSQTIADARKSDDVATLHTALDQMQAGVTKMEGQMKICHAMMEHMMPMQGRGGMMNPPAPDAPR